MHMARQRLTAEAWVTAALEALRTRGLAAVAVEPLAAELGATKGSFYWHFKDREALVHATLERWEHEETDAVISHLAAIDEPRQRLAILFDLVITHQEDSDLVVSIFRDSDHPAVAAALSRVTRRRIDYVAAQLVESGFRPAEAERRAVVAYAAYVGWWQLRAIDPQRTPKGRRAAKHAEILRELLRPYSTGR
jgi:AcrR family transcriptional regulator